MNDLVVDLFAGGGGASTGIAWAIGRDPDIAVNHDPIAIAMHRANHPGSRHFCESVFKVVPREVVGDRRVGLLWLSPDCTHHSKAKGGKPRSKKIRSLAWVAIRWAAEVRPRVIMLENVEEFADWGPLTPDGFPCSKRKGKTFRAWVRKLERYGYEVQHRLLVAADFGTPTTRKRLFLIARCDGQPITWPRATHGKGRARAWRTAAEIIDWSLPCPSIFERGKPLKPATLARIAEGVRRYVLRAQRPFIAPVTHPRDTRVHSVSEPLRTITGANRGEFSLVVPTLIQTGYGEREGQTPRVPGLEKPLGTVVAAGSKHALVAALITKHYSRATGHELGEPLSTITAQDHHALTAAFLTKFYGSTKAGADARQPLPTVTAKGWHLGEVRALLERHSPAQRSLHDDCNATVTIGGELYAVTDIGMRMLQPHELFAAQGFPPDYEIRPSCDRLVRGKWQHGPLTKTEQIALAGNSVCPQVARALVTANLEMAAGEARSA